MSDDTIYLLLVGIGVDFVDIDVVKLWRFIDDHKTNNAIFEIKT